MKFLRNIKSKDLSGEIALLRVDFNVEKIEDSLRLAASIPTIEWLIARGAKVVLMSHRGRPASRDEELSLKIVLLFLESKLGKKVVFIPDFNFSQIKNKIAASTPGSIFLLENLRFNPEEELNGAGFAKNLASLGTIYVNDAFAVSHRKNASVYAITKFIPSYAGLLFEKEYANLSKVMRGAKKPLVFIIGGAKTADKASMIKNFLSKADVFLLGGGAGNTGLAARGVEVGQSVYDPELVPMMAKLLKSKKIVLPEDWLMDGGRILDIGPLTIEKYRGYIAKAKTIVWNGPLGLFEEPRFAVGSMAVARAIAAAGAFSVIGGGETTQLVLSLGLQNKISFLSTAGGAMLEFLAGKKLPGVEALNR